MVLNLVELERNCRWKWFSRPFQATIMNVENHYDHFRVWREEMDNLPILAEEEDYIAEFIKSLKWDIRFRLSKSIHKHNWRRLNNVFCAAKFEESMILLEKALKQFEAHKAFDELPSRILPDIQQHELLDSIWYVSNKMAEPLGNEDVNLIEQPVSSRNEVLHSTVAEALEVKNNLSYGGNVLDAKHVLDTQVIPEKGVCDVPEEMFQQNMQTSDVSLVEDKEDGGPGDLGNKAHNMFDKFPEPSGGIPEVDLATEVDLADGSCKENLEGLTLRTIVAYGKEKNDKNDFLEDERKEANSEKVVNDSENSAWNVFNKMTKLVPTNFPLSYHLYLSNVAAHSPIFEVPLQLGGVSDENQLLIDTMLKSLSLKHEDDATRQSKLNFKLDLELWESKVTFQGSQFNGICVLQLFRNGSKSLIDDGDILSFDPGGYSLDHMDCGIFEKLCESSHGWCFCARLLVVLNIQQ